MELVQSFEQVGRFDEGVVVVVVDCRRWRDGRGRRVHVWGVRILALGPVWDLWTSAFLRRALKALLRRSTIEQRRGQATSNRSGDRDLLMPRTDSSSFLL